MTSVRWVSKHRHRLPLAATPRLLARILRETMCTRKDVGRRRSLPSLTWPPPLDEAPAPQPLCACACMNMLLPSLRTQTHCGIDCVHYLFRQASAGRCREFSPLLVSSLTLLCPCHGPLI